MQPEPLTPEEIAEFKVEGWAELLIVIDDQTFNREDCWTCVKCGRAVIEETNEYGECRAGCNNS
jgi:hypothetical protein